MWQYAKMGVLWLGIKEIIRCILHGRSLKAVYPVVTKLVDQELVNQYDTQSEIATIREHGSLRYGASAYDNEDKVQGTRYKVQGCKNLLNQSSTLNPLNHLEPASVTSDLNSEASAEDLNQRASASALNPLNHLEPASVTSDLNSEASAEVLNQRKY